MKKYTVIRNTDKKEAQISAESFEKIFESIEAYGESEASWLNGCATFEAYDNVTGEHKSLKYIRAAQ